MYYNSSDSHRPPLDGVKNLEMYDRLKDELVALKPGTQFRVLPADKTIESIGNVLLKLAPDSLSHIEPYGCVWLETGVLVPHYSELVHPNWTDFVIVPIRD
jgi:hypothetical protein